MAGPEGRSQPISASDMKGVVDTCTSLYLLPDCNFLHPSRNDDDGAKDTVASIQFVIFVHVVITGDYAFSLWTGFVLAILHDMEINAFEVCVPATAMITIDPYSAAVMTALFFSQFFSPTIST